MFPEYRATAIELSDRMRVLENAAPFGMANHKNIVNPSTAV